MCSSDLQELRIAAQMQQSILPLDWPSDERHALHGFMQAARHVGGGAAKVDVKVDGRLYVQGRQEDVAKTLTRTERAVNIGASSMINIIAQELTPESLTKEGVSFNSTVGAHAGGTEVRVGVNKDLGEGISVGAGVGASSGHGSLYIGKSHDVTEHLRVNMTASFDGTRVQAGPGVTLHKDGYGMGASTFGPSVLINNVSIPIGPTAPANLLVTGIVGAYKAITGKTKKEIDDLKTQLSEKDKTLEEMKTSLSERDKVLEDLKEQMQAMQMQIQKMSQIVMPPMVVTPLPAALGK